MVQQIDLEKIAQKAYRDSLEDGVMELGMGVYLMVCALPVANVSFSFVYAFLILFFRPAWQRVKQRVTYPRIGYVEHVSKDLKETVRGIAVVMLALIVVLAVVLAIMGEVDDFGVWMKWLPALIGTFVVGAFLYVRSKSGAPRFYVLAVISVAIGVAMSIVDFDSEVRLPGLIGYLGCMGFVLAVWGGAMLARFVRKYPVVAEEGVDGGG